MQKLLRTSGQKSHNSSCHEHSSDIVNNRGEGLEDVEGANDENGQEQSVVVKDAKSGSFIFGYLIFLPQNPFIFLLTRDLLVTRIQLKNGKK